MLKQQLEHFSFSFIEILIRAPQSSQMVSESLKANSEPKYGWSPEVWCLFTPHGVQLLLLLWDYNLTLPNVSLRYSVITTNPQAKIGNRLLNLVSKGIQVNLRARVS